MSSGPTGSQLGGQGASVGARKASFMSAMAELRPGPSEQQRLLQEQQREQFRRDLEEQVGLRAAAGALDGAALPAAPPAPCAMSQGRNQGCCSSSSSSWSCQRAHAAPRAPAPQVRHKREREAQQHAEQHAEAARDEAKLRAHYQRLSLEQQQEGRAAAPPAQQQAWQAQQQEPLHMHQHASTSAAALAADSSEGRPGRRGRSKHVVDASWLDAAATAQQQQQQQRAHAAAAAGHTPPRHLLQPGLQAERSSVNVVGHSQASLPWQHPQHPPPPPQQQQREQHDHQQWRHHQDHQRHPEGHLQQQQQQQQEAGGPGGEMAGLLQQLQQEQEELRQELERQAGAMRHLLADKERASSEHDTARRELQRVQVGRPACPARCAAAAAAFLEAEPCLAPLPLGPCCAARAAPLAP
jgi:hypothetical protein